MDYKRKIEQEIDFKVFEDHHEFMMYLLEKDITRGISFEYWELGDGEGSYVELEYVPARQERGHQFYHRVDFKDFDPSYNQALDPEFFEDRVRDLIDNCGYFYCTEDILDAIGFYDEESDLWYQLCKSYDLLEDEDDE